MFGDLWWLCSDTQFFLWLLDSSTASWLLAISSKSLMNAKMQLLNYSHFHQFHLRTWWYSSHTLQFNIMLINDMTTINFHFIWSCLSSISVMESYQLCKKHECLKSLQSVSIYELYAVYSLLLACAHTGEAPPLGITFAQRAWKIELDRGILDNLEACRKMWQRHKNSTFLGKSLNAWSWVWIRGAVN